MIIESLGTVASGAVGAGVKPVGAGQASAGVVARQAQGPQTSGERQTELPGQRPSDAVSVEDARQATEKINETVKLFNNGLRFSLDEETGMRIVKVVDMDTDQVIRQIPTEEVVVIARALDKLKGLLIKQEA